MKKTNKIKIGPEDVPNLGRVEKQCLASECVDAFKIIPKICDAFSLLALIACCSCAGYTFGAIGGGGYGFMLLSFVGAAVFFLFVYCSTKAKSQRLDAAMIFLGIGIGLVVAAIISFFAFRNIPVVVFIPIILSVSSVFCIRIGLNAVYYAKMFKALEKEEGFPFFFETYGQSVSEVYHEYERSEPQEPQDLPEGWKPWEAFEEDVISDSDDETTDESSTEVKNEKIS
ncbi:MAG: hypothetical protein GX051_05305 [Clostridiales bacterium]|nr:hypothetical protein [Clostridiales bacterium]